MRVAGGDPGSHGCIAFIRDGLLDVFLRLSKSGYVVQFSQCKAYMERVHWRPGDHKKPTQIEQMFRHAAKMELVFEFSRCEVELVEPITWQLEFGLGGIDEYEDRKRAAHKIAQELYPQHKITKDAADGILVATYGWRKETGALTNGRNPDKETRQGTGIQWESRQQI